MFQRPIRHGFNRPALPPTLATEYERANEYLQNGQPEQAAALLDQLAEQVNAIGHPRQAANLFAQAAHAWVNAGKDEPALIQARRALAIFTRMAMGQRAMQFKSRFSQHLRNKNMLSTALIFEKETDLPLESGFGRPRRQLPSACPQCGAPVHSDKVKWIDNASAECDFCGSVIHTLN